MTPRANEFGAKNRGTKAKLRAELHAGSNLPSTRAPSFLAALFFLHFFTLPNKQSGCHCCFHFSLPTFPRHSHCAPTRSTSSQNLTVLRRRSSLAHKLANPFPTPVNHSDLHITSSAHSACAPASRALRFPLDERITSCRAQFAPHPQPAARVSRPSPCSALSFSRASPRRRCASPTGGRASLPDCAPRRKPRICLYLVAFLLVAQRFLRYACVNRPPTRRASLSRAPFPLASLSRVAWSRLGHAGKAERDRAFSPAVSKEQLIIVE